MSAERVCWCELDGNAGVGMDEVVVVVSAGHVGGTRGSGMVSSAADVLWIRAVRMMRGVCGVCVTCMCLARGGVGGDGDELLGGLAEEQGECWTCVCVLLCGWCMW